MKISGYIGKPGFSKHNRNYQTAVVNGRVVSNNTISVAASKAYGGMLMKRCYPVYVLNIVMPAEDMDVNVHPNKKEVRFKDVNAVFSCVYRFFTSALAYQETHMQFESGKEKSDAADARQNSAKQQDNYENTVNSNQSGNNSSKNITLDNTSDIDKLHKNCGKKSAAETGDAKKSDGTTPISDEKPLSKI